MLNIKKLCSNIDINKKKMSRDRRIRNDIYRNNEVNIDDCRRKEKMRMINENRTYRFSQPSEILIYIDNWWHIPSVRQPTLIKHRFIKIVWHWLKMIMITRSTRHSIGAIIRTQCHQKWIAFKSSSTEGSTINNNLFMISFSRLKVNESRGNSSESLIWISRWFCVHLYSERWADIFIQFSRKNKRMESIDSRANLSIFRRT